MKSFKTFIAEMQANSPIVPVEATKFDLKDESTFNEINKNLDTVLAPAFSNPGEAFNKVRKVLAMYRIELPDQEFEDDKKGSIEIPITQKETSGENYYNVTPPNAEITKDHKLIFNYNLKSGVYEVGAVIEEI